MSAPNVLTHARLREATTHAKRPKSRWTVCGLLARRCALGTPDGATCPECAPQPCACGCGEAAPTGRRYLHGHNRRHALPPDVETAVAVIRAAGPEARRQVVAVLEGMLATEAP